MRILYYGFQTWQPQANFHYALETFVKRLGKFCNVISLYHPYSMTWWI